MEECFVLAILAIEAVLLPKSKVTLTCIGVNLAAGSFSPWGPQH